MGNKVRLGPANVADGELRSYEVGKRAVLVTKIDGKFKALDDWCNHAGCLLSGGRLEGNMVVCPCHEIGFDMDTGKNVTSPGIADDQPTVKLNVEEGQLVLEDFDPEG